LWLLFQSNAESRIRRTTTIETIGHRWAPGVPSAVLLSALCLCGSGSGAWVGGPGLAVSSGTPVLGAVADLGTFGAGSSEDTGVMGAVAGWLGSASAGALGGSEGGLVFRCSVVASGAPVPAGPSPPPACAVTCVGSFEGGAELFCSGVPASARPPPPLDAGPGPGLLVT